MPPIHRDSWKMRNIIPGSQSLCHDGESKSLCILKCDVCRRITPLVTWLGRVSSVFWNTILWSVHVFAPQHYSVSLLYHHNIENGLSIILLKTIQSLQSLHVKWISTLWNNHLNWEQTDNGKEYSQSNKWIWLSNSLPLFYHKLVLLIHVGHFYLTK